MIFKAYQKNIYLFLLALVAVTIPFDVTVNNIALALLVLYWLLSGNLQNKMVGVLKNKYFWIFSAVYLIQLIGFLYSTDVDDALSKLEKKAGLVLLPFIILSLPPVKGKHLFFVIISFTLGCIVIFGYAIINILNRFGSFTKVPQLTEVIDDIIHLHHAYSGLYLVFSIITIIYFLNLYWSKISFIGRFFAFIVIITLYAFLIILGARMALFISFLILALQMITFSYNAKNYKFLVMIALTIIIGLAGVFSLSATRSKLHEIIFLRGVYSPFTPRLIQWHCSFDILNETDSWLTGVGTGDVKPLLQECYQDKKFWGHLYNYNLHNEYLEEMLRHGLMGLSLLLVVFIFPIIISIKRKNYLYIFFILSFMIACISESIFNRQKGVVFFAFFNALLFLFSSSGKNYINKKMR